MSFGFKEEVSVRTVVQLFEEDFGIRVVANHLHFSQHGLILGLDHGLDVEQLAILRDKHNGLLFQGNCILQSLLSQASFLFLICCLSRGG